MKNSAVEFIIEISQYDDVKVLLLVLNFVHNYLLLKFCA